jgi:hypothetical protein
MVLATAAALIIVSCGRTSGELATPAKESREDVEWVTKAIVFSDGLQKNREEVLREIGKVEFAFHRRLLTFSGIEEELGSPAAADAVLRALMNEVYSRAMQTDYQWLKVADDTGPNGMSAVAMASFEFMLISMNFDDLAAQDPGTRSSGEGANRVEVDVAMDGLEYTSTKEVTVDGMNVKMLNRLKVNYCPDSSGKIEVEMSSTSSLSRGAKGANTKIDVHVTRYVDDDAKMEALDVEQHVEAAAFGGGAGTFVDISQGVSTRGDGPNYNRVNRASSRATDADGAMAGALANIMQLMAIGASEHTREVWEKGGCVKLDTPTTPVGRAGLKPGASFKIVAQPRSRLDGASVGGTVRADLTGDSSLDPASTKVRADASFTYVAPGERKKEARIKFEARSRRGIAISELAFNTNGASYRVEGGADEFHGTGVACDLAEQFFIEGSGVTVRFEPESPAGGRYSYSGKMSGFEVFGHGVYTVNFRDDVAVSISAHGPGSVRTPMGVQTAEGKEEYSLSPSSGAGCGVT